MRIAIIGGGIGGLATAFRLRERLPEAEILVLEAGTRWGGVCRTLQAEGCTLEEGPDSLIRTKPAGMRLIADLGLDGEVIGTEPAARHGLIARGRRLHAVPEGLYLLAPGRIWPFLCSPIVSWRGKLRMGLDLVLPRRAADAPEESLAQFVRRRLGREALERVAQPMVGGIYTADPERLSLAATMPQFLEMEAKHRSLILAMRARAKAEQSACSASGPRYGLFATLRGGLGRLPEALLARLAGCDLRLGAAARGLARADGGWRVRLADGGCVDADAVVLALPAHAAARLLGEADAALGAELAGIPYAGVATVNLLYDARGLPALPAAAGFVVPAVEPRTVIACTFASQKYGGRVPAGTVALRAFVGGALHEQALARDDQGIVAACGDDLHELLGFPRVPRFASVHRWPAAMAQPVLGHRERVARVREREAALPRLALVGNGYEGVGIPDLCAQAEAAAQRLAQALAAGAAR